MLRDTSLQWSAEALVSFIGLCRRGAVHGACADGRAPHCQEHSLGKCEKPFETLGNLQGH